MTKLLTLKHWQLFGILVGLPMLYQFITIGSMFSSNDPTEMFFFFPIVMILVMVLFFGWFYALGTNLHKKLPKTATMNLNKFKIFLFIPVVYILFICVFMFVLFSNTSIGGQPNLAIFAVIIPLHLFSMFCVFYCLYFIAKALKTVEWQKTVTFSDFAGEFFLIWLFPIGLWIIQPRLNKIFDPKVGVDSNQFLDQNI